MKARTIIATSGMLISGLMAGAGVYMLTNSNYDSQKDGAGLLVGFGSLLFFGSCRICCLTKKRGYGPLNNNGEAQQRLFSTSQTESAAQSTGTAPDSDSPAAR